MFDAKDFCVDDHVVENVLLFQPRVKLYEGVLVDNDTWNIMLLKSDARFVRDTALLLWGAEVLARRCINAERANKHVGSVCDGGR